MSSTVEPPKSGGVVKVCTLSGAPVAEISPPPPDVAALKAELEARTGCPRALQKLIASAEARVYLDGDGLAEEDSLQLNLVVDETPLFTWDVEGNPGSSMLEGQGGVVSSPNLRSDYCNVLTKEPLRSGRHYFRFIMHQIGDEQWCGVIRDALQAGPRWSGRLLNAWTYYCGRMHCNSSSIVDGSGALHAQGRAVKEFKKLRPQGDVIGMLVDLDVGAVAFDLNGELQGACAVPREPLWVLTHLDEPGDRVELEKPSLADAPPGNLDALTGALLDVSQGQRCGWFAGTPSSSSGGDPADAPGGEDHDSDDDGIISDHPGTGDH